MKRYGLMLVLCCAGAVSAQVNKCMEPGGKVSYSELPCAGAQRGGQVLGRDATVRRPEEDAYHAQRNRDSLARTLNQQREMIDGPAQIPRVEPERRAAGAPPNSAENTRDTEGCETFSHGKGCYGGERARNPNWSLRKGYFGGGGPADQRREEEERSRAAAGPGQMVNCDRAGCWGSSNGVRYNRAAGGNLTGANGQFCVRTGNTFNCN